MAYQATILDVTKHKTGCCICFAMLQTSDLVSTSSASRPCDYHEGVAKAAYESMSSSGATLNWHHKGYKLMCRTCDVRVYGTTNRPITSPGAEKEYEMCGTMYNVGCFMCDESGPPIHQLFVEVDGQTRARMFACTLTHLEQLISHMLTMRERNYAEGWCKHCNLMYPNSSTSPPIQFRIRTIGAKQSSWIRVSSWVAWWNKMVENGVQEKLF